MISHTVSLIFLICILTYLLAPTVYAEEDLYSVLDVDTSASASEIKQAYKKLARIWHPDKNPSPAANEKFMKINEAYETLSDPKKRENYDRFGTSSGQANSQQGFDHPFDSFFQDGPFGGFKANNRINLWTYEKEIYPNSIKKPFFVYAYVNFCLQCVRVWPIWEQFTKDLEKLGVGIGTLDVNSDPLLRQRLKVRSIPSVVVVIERRIVHFDTPSFSIRTLRDFLRSVHPSNLVAELQEHDLSSFLSDFWSNKVKVLMFDSRKHSCLRFLSSAFTARHNVQAAHVNTKKLQAGSELWRKYRLSGEENMVVVKEDNSSHTTSATSLTRAQMDLAMSHLLLAPRLSSAHMLQHVCPIKKHCVLLLLWGKSDKAFLDSFVAAATPLRAPTFAYVTNDLQPALVAALSMDSGPQHNNSLHKRKLMGIWRKSDKQWKYEMMEGGWGVDGDGGLGAWVDSLMKKGGRMDSTLVLKEVPIVDEDTEGVWQVVLRKMQELTDLAVGLLESFDSPFSTLIITSVVLFCAILVLRNVFQPPAELLHAGLEQLDSEAYDHLVLNARSSGWRLVVLLLREEWSLAHKRECLQAFSSATQPYTSSHFRFRFMYMHLTKHRLRWCRRLFTEAFKQSGVPPVVVAINPTLMYYHYLPPSDDHFLDMEDEMVEVEAWMDRLYEGRCSKHSVSTWPDTF